MSFELDGRPVEVADDAGTLLDALRDHLDVRSVKDGCSPQGQCGCCTVLVDGAPRVACVTPIRRIAGRSVTTVGGLPAEEADAWGESFCATGGSQCGFCTPGIVLRLEALRRKGGLDDPARVEQTLLAHLCRCTGWQTVVEASQHRAGRRVPVASATRDLEAASRRATIEGGVGQPVGPGVALGHHPFADDVAPADALVAVPDGEGGWAVGETLAEARMAAGKIQGRRTTVETPPPLELPHRDGDVSLRTSWVEPAALETDASWCEPGGDPASPLANGGAFGAKTTGLVERAARELADRHGRPVRVLLGREDTVRLGPKRPPIAGVASADGTGLLRVARTDGIAEAIGAAAPDLEVEEVEVAGPPTSAALRMAGFAEATMLLAGARGEASTVETPVGGKARADIDADGAITVEVWAGTVLDEVVLRSYCIGAAHMALSWVSSEGLAVDENGEVLDLTIRSFGILRAVDTPPIEVRIHDDGGEPVNGSDAVFCSVAAAAWLRQGCPTDLPTRRWPTGAGRKAS